MEEKIYKCVCGKEFATPNSFNGHKSGCKEHHISKYGNLDRYVERYANSTAKSTQIIKTQAEQKHKLQLEQWLSECHTCKKCGKIMTTKFGSGQFCSRQCANSHVRTEESKQLTSKRMLAKLSSSIELRSLAQEHKKHEYSLRPNHCEVCNCELSYEYRNRKTCSDNCYKKLLSIRSKANPTSGGLRQGSGTGKHGWYKGYYCDSTYELVYVIYNIDHNISFERNKKSYEYIGTDDKLHLYYPDFIQDNMIVEIKGVLDLNVYRKLAAIDDYPVKLLLLEDLKPMFEYVKNTYTYKDITELYVN